jgi:hypothetical protein
MVYEGKEMTSAAAKKAWATRKAKKPDIGLCRAEKHLHEKAKRRKFSKVQALTDGFGYSRKEAIAALKDMGE